MDAAATKGNSHQVARWRSESITEKGIRLFEEAQQCCTEFISGNIPSEDATALLDHLKNIVSETSEEAALATTILTESKKMNEV